MKGGSVIGPIYRRSCDGTSSPAKACVPSCGFGYCTGLSKMVLLYWVGDTLGRATMIILTVMETSISDYWQHV
ncbi:hypothetical protein V6N12_075172 [Hibiscus sabdariffa]|uniref:Uncharacterized protein n=1 Tax=Hibiscus sabdariffa TaxID=183260 RepID=A0ABR2BZS1_9ROSI